MRIGNRPFSIERIEQLSEYNASRLGDDPTHERERTLAREVLFYRGWAGFFADVADELGNSDVMDRPHYWRFYRAGRRAFHEGKDKTTFTTGYGRGTITNEV